MLIVRRHAGDVEAARAHLGDVLATAQRTGLDELQRTVMSLRAASALAD